MDILKLVEPKDLLDFSQNFSVTRSYLGDTLFPDTKTQNFKAEFYRLADSRMLPTMAPVHALDAEAHIGQRPALEKVTLEKMLIKEKINQSERIQIALDNGAAQNTLVQYIFDDAARLAEAVKTRTEVMKCDVLQTGALTINENGVKLSVDYGVPSANKISLDFSSTGDPLTAIQTMVDTAADAGQKLTTVVTSTKVVTAMRKHASVQTAINGVNAKGTLVTRDAFTNFMEAEFGLTIQVNDGRYQYEGAKGKLTANRYIDANKFIGLATLPNGTVGTGLWGVTPEELAYGPWTAKSQNQYITVSMWQEPDPVATWTKASGLFIPVVPNPKGIYIGTVTM